MNPFKMIFKTKQTKIWFWVTVPVVVLTLVVAILVSTVLFDLVCFIWGYPTTVGRGKGKFFKPVSVSREDAYDRGNALTETIGDEGFVLLKNAGAPAALPFTESVKNVSVFGKNSVNLVYGGTGSGGGDFNGAKTVYESLSTAGYTYNPALKSFYENDNSALNGGSGPKREKIPSIDNVDLNIIRSYETPWNDYGDTLKGSVSGFNDAAIIVFSRIGGEGFDLLRSMTADPSKHYFQLDANEQSLIDGVKALNPGKIVVIINSGSVLQIPELENDPRIDAIIQMGGAGYTGVMALGRILSGEVTPSAHTVDTWASDFKKDPTWNNFGHYLYEGGTVHAGGPEKSHTYVDYEEGIYVGYRYYETRGADELKSNPASTWYSDNVVYPFGYGLSYTTFSWEIENASDLSELTVNDNNKNTDIEIKVKVTNTGSRKGKDVVQLYCTPRYIDNGIEKSHVVLSGFEKTPMLYPASEANATDKPNGHTVTLKFNPYDVASYDYNDANGNLFKGYELDAGAHALKLQTDAHTPKAGIPEITFTVADGGIKYQNDPKSNNNVENRFCDVAEGVNGSGEISADAQLKDVSVNGQTRKGMSRTDFIGTWPKDASEAANRQTLTDDTKSRISSTAHNNPNVPTEMHTTDAPASKMLVEMKDVPYGDDAWDEFLDTLSFEEMRKLFASGAFHTESINRLGKVATIDSDGPVGWTNFKEGVNISKTVAYASQAVIGATWNKELAQKMGESVGEEGIWGTIVQNEDVPYSGWYAPGVNIHRSPFSGRNFEYYSEDSHLSGMLGAYVVKGAQSKGVYPFAKHFALNDQETNREGITTWATEQSMREIYFKPFELLVKVGGARGIMSSFNRIGTKWTGGDYRLLTEVLRNEWDFEGAVICDFNVSIYMNIRQMLYAGGDLNLATHRASVSVNASDAGDVAMLRSAAHNVLFTVANSNAMNGLAPDSNLRTIMPLWYTLIWVFVPIIWAGLAAWGFFAIRKSLKKK